MAVAFPEPMSASLRSTQAISSSIEESPLNLATWEALMAKVNQQNDTLSIKSLEIIIEGLKAIQELNSRAEQQKAAPPQLSTMTRATFVRLAKSYNSPTLLKEAGLIYLRDLSLPKIALQHFERSIRLGGPEK